MSTIGRKEAVRSLLTWLVQKKSIRSALRALTRQGFLPRSVWKRLPYRGTFRVTLPDGRRSFRYKAGPNDQMGRPLFWRGWQGAERETVRVFCRLARSARYVLDVGAYTGVYTLLAAAANPKSRVVSFEPVPSIYQRLVENIALNEWEERCRAVNAGVLDEERQAEMHVPERSALPTSSSFDQEGFRGYAGATVEVPTVTLDAACENFQEEMDLVKIDVEGFEDKVLLGMREVLERAHPDIIVVELCT